MAPVLADIGAVTMGALDPRGTLVVPVLNANPTNTGVVFEYCTLMLVILTPNTGASTCRPMKLKAAMAAKILRQPERLNWPLISSRW